MNVDWTQNASEHLADIYEYIARDSKRYARRMVDRITPQCEERWLECQLDKGMFSDEVAVTYPATGTWKKSVFVPQKTVQGDIGSRGKVRVLVVRRNGKMLAVLPSPQHDVVEVVESDTSTD